LALLTFPGFITRGLASQDEKSAQQIFKELVEKVEKFMPKLRSCALASFAALNEQFDINADDKTLRALMPFTGGLALKGETCGAVSGTLLAMGYYYESKDKKENQMLGTSIMPGGRFLDAFTKEFGSTRCKDVVEHQYGRAYDFLNPEDMKLFMERSEKENKCLDVVKKAVLLAGEIMLRAGN
jgi:C_GCAxxG_C_C family probable redox protein